MIKQQTAAVSGGDWNNLHTQLKLAGAWKKGGKPALRAELQKLAPASKPKSGARSEADRASKK